MGGLSTASHPAFLKRNGVFRLALFETPMQEVSGLRALPPLQMSSVASRSSTCCPRRGVQSRLEATNGPHRKPH
ncbi:hypothetical protein METHP14_10175 [Pseudomonas sp. P14-2025]